ncbi:DNA repair exonuclease SbcCD nuclease subunit [Lactobacillus colini]|uniref:DNA repair exonuclease SbcCD nuclease subunit n=1 Tax=Lactobacillus colini TaxID=1819254 RepID=A0ABS4MFW8_9LACO|nr:DNA repair exonuclease [Lactobacillus colini]MBP2058262.1 DNA repair exonuclease SbcCD nuclease subunit [Lactobacillus colini]
MKFIHLSDAHLDSPFLGLSFLPSKQFEQIKQTTEISFKRSVDYAIDEQVDLFLIAGDTFDSIHPSPKSQVFLVQQLRRLVDHEIQVVMILGNHDYLNPEEMLLVNSTYFKLLGQDQKIESANFKTKSNFEYVVHGFSYRENHIEQDMAAQFPIKVTGKYNIGLMHAGEKMQKGHNVYAPFTLSELKNLNYDYFALGHIHHRQVLSEHPLIAYSGNLQGRHINEQGAKGFDLIEVNEKTKQAQISFIATAPIEWHEAKFNLQQELALSDLIEQIAAKLNAEMQKRSLWGINIYGSDFLTEKEADFLQESEALEEISRKLNNNSLLVRIKLHADENLSLNKSDQAAFNQAQKQVLNKSEILTLGQSLAKKDDWLADMMQDDNFVEEVKSLTQVKLGQKLKELNDEIN